MLEVSSEKVGPYRILRRLGEGGMGVVDLGCDAAGNLVALKRLSRVSGALLDALKREVRALAQLNHPNIVKIYDHDLSAEVPWYAMEYLGEASLRDRLHDGPQIKTLVDASVTIPWEETLVSIDSRTLLLDGAPLDELGESSIVISEPLNTDQWQELLRSMLDVCAGLSALHAAGMVHRDLKPENILFRDDGSAVIVDFGISVLAEGGGRQRITRSLRASGTPAYLSPEQVLSRPLDARSDLYSLGIILFEILTGRVPFDHAMLIRVLQDHVYTVPPNARSLNPEVPEVLCDLVARLVEKEPHCRLGYAIDVDQELRRALSVSPPGYEAPLYSYAPRWVGREDEMQRLTDLARDVSKRGLGRVVHICGEAGIGKTRLVNEMIQGVAHYVPVYVGFGIADSARPFAAFAIVWGSMAEDDQEGAQRLRLEYEDWWDAISQRSRPLTWEDVQVAYKVLTSIATDTARIVVIDDAQWVDPWSVMLIERLSADPPARLGLILVSRDDPNGAQIECADRIELGRMSRADVKDVVMSMIGVSALADTYLDFALRETDGNPLLLAELVRSVMQAKVLRRDEAGVWHIAAERVTTPEELPISERLTGVFKQGFERAESRVQRTLEVMASIGVSVDPQVLMDLASSKSRRAVLPEVDLRSLVDSGMVVFEGQRLRFKNGLLAREIYRGIETARLEAIHLAIAEYLEGRSSDRNPFKIGKHLSRSGAVRRAAPYHWKAHELAHQAGNFAESVKQFHLWSRGSEEPRAIFWEKVFAVLERDFVMSGGVFIETCELLHELATNAEPGVRALVLSYRIRAGFAQPEDVKRGWLEEAHEAARLSGSKEILLHLRVSERYVIEDHEPERLAEALKEIVDEAAEIGPVHHVRALIDFSSDRIFNVDYEAARLGLQTAESIDSDSLPVSLRNRLKVCRAMLEGESGQHEMALKAYEEVLVEHRRSGSDRDICLTLWNIANQLSSLGRYAESYQTLQEAETISSFAPYFQLRAIVTMLLGTVTGNLGNSAEAHHLFRRAESIFNHPENRGVRLYGHFKVLHATFLRRVGRWEEAKLALPELGREPFLDACILAELGFTTLHSGLSAASEIQRMETIVEERRFQPTSKPGRLLAALKRSEASPPEARWNGEHMGDIPPLLFQSTMSAFISSDPI